MTPIYYAGIDPAVGIERAGKVIRETPLPELPTSLPFDYNGEIRSAMEHINDVTRNALLSTADAFNIASAGIGDYRLGDIEVGNWIRGVPFEFVEVLKTISFFLSLIFLILFVSIWLRLRLLNAPATSIVDEILPPEPAPGGPMTARWAEVMRHMDSVKEAEWKFAIIEADKLLDEALKKGGYPGGSLGERLTLIEPGQLQSLQSAWDAHKVRNMVAHDFNYFLRYTEAKHAVDHYGTVLKELGAI